MDAYVDTTIETAMIMNIDMSKWTVDVMTQFSDKLINGVPWSLPYLHSEAGEGLLYVPEVGAQCLLCTPSDGELSPFVLAYLPIPKEDSYRANRVDMNPGDIGMMSRDGNFVIVRRGGVVQIGATQVAQRIYLPVANTIRDFAQNYSLTTFGGELVWEVDDQSADTSGTPARLRIRARQFVEDQQGGHDYYPVALTVGKSLPKGDSYKTAGEDNLALVSGESPLVEINVALAGQTGFNFSVDGKGSVFVRAGGNVRWDVDKDLTYNVKGARTTVVGGTDAIKANKRTEDYQTHVAKYRTSSERAESQKRIDAPNVQIGNLVLGTERAVLSSLVTALCQPGAFMIVNGAVVPSPGFIAQAQLALSSSVYLAK